MEKQKTNRAINPTAKQWDKAEVIKLIDNVGQQAQTVQNNIQRIAVVAIGYANIHGDITVAQRACEVFSGKKGIRFNSFVKYLEVHGQMQWDAKAKTVTYMKRDSVIKDPAQLLESLSVRKWYEATPQEPVESIYDVKAQIEKLIKAATKAADSGKKVSNAELLENLSNLVT